MPCAIYYLNEETPTEVGTIHTAHCIIQEVETDSRSPARDLPQVPKSHERTVHPIIEDLQPYFAKSKAEPDLNITRSRSRTL